MASETGPTCLNAGKLRMPANCVDILAYCAEGMRQVQRYVKEMEDLTGQGWTGSVVTY